MYESQQEDTKNAFFIYGFCHVLPGLHVLCCQNKGILHLKRKICNEAQHFLFLSICIGMK